MNWGAFDPPEPPETQEPPDSYFCLMQVIETVGKIMNVDHRYWWDYKINQQREQGRIDRYEKFP